MDSDLLRYDRMVEDALRNVVREALRRVSGGGLPGDHHFYITFRTTDPGVDISSALRAQYPKEITIVLQHQFWGLEVGETGFSVTLSFSGRHERLIVPFASIVSFADPSVKFGLQFEAMNKPDGEAEAAETGKSATKEQTSIHGGARLPAPAAPAGLLAAKPGDGASVAKSGEKNTGEVVALDAFRKK
jgi:hypothetical protein